MAKRIDIPTIGLNEPERPASRARVKESRARDKYKLVAVYLELEQNKALENLKNIFIQQDQKRDKSDLVREAVNDLLEKYSKIAK